MSQSKRAAAYGARIKGLAAAMLAASIGIACAQQRYPSRADQIYDANANPKPQLALRAGTARVSIALERVAAKGWVPVPCTPKVQAT
jgi:hypothetical protein